MEAFIEGVRMRPCLWNPMHSDYREKHIKDKAWEAVIAHYNNESIPNINVAKSEWKKLRDNHRDALKRAKLGKNKLLPAYITNWKYAKAMQFLEPHMKYRITENIEEIPTVTREMDHDAEHAVQPTEAHDSRAPVSSGFGYDGDALESFFYSILKCTRDMPQWMQTQVKKKVFAVIIEAEEQLASSQMQSERTQMSTPGDTQVKLEIYTDECSESSFE